MSAKEISDLILELLRILMSWPVVFFLVFFLFRKQIQQFLPDFGEQKRRLTGEDLKHYTLATGGTVN